MLGSSFCEPITLNPISSVRTLQFVPTFRGSARIFLASVGRSSALSRRRCGGELEGHGLLRFLYASENIRFLSTPF
jgi:hypothetical protein